MGGLVRHAAALIALAGAVVASGCGRERRSIQGPYAKIANDVIPRIEELTGLAFKADPKIEGRSRDEVREFLERRFREDLPDEEIQGTQAAYARFGLIPDTLDLRAFLLDVLTEQVVGFYDHNAKVLYVVDGIPPEQVSGVVSHELVHALQDQHMRLDSIVTLRGDNDRSLAAQAIIEGQATIVHVQAALGGADLATAFPGGWDRVREMIREMQSQMPVFSMAPRLIQETLIFPYLSGAEFMHSFQQLRPGETPYSAMPVSTEQIMHARAYFNERDVPTRITLPAPRVGRDRYQNNLGEFETRLFLYEHMRDQSGAVRGAAGWDGDRYMVVTTPRGEALVWVTVWDSPAEATDFTDALDRAIARRFDGELMRPTASGKRYELTNDREVSWWSGEIAGRAAIIYTDAPAGVGEVISPARVKVEQ